MAKLAGCQNFVLAAHGVLWDGQHVSPHEEVNKRSRLARVVLVAAGLERGGARVTAQKGFAANWHQPRLSTDVTNVLLDKDKQVPLIRLGCSPLSTLIWRCAQTSARSSPNKERWTSLFVALGDMSVMVFCSLMRATRPRHQSVSTPRAGRDMTELRGVPEAGRDSAEG